MATTYFLVVDHNYDEIDWIVRSLDRLACRMDFYHATDGLEGIDTLHAALRQGSDELPRFVLHDIDLPRLDGIQAVQQIRKAAALRDLPVVMFSSSTENVDVERSYAAGATAYCVKPMIFEDYMQVLAVILARWGLSTNQSSPAGKGSLLSQYFRFPPSLRHAIA